MCQSNRGSEIVLQYFLNWTGTVLPTTGVAVFVAVAVKEGVGVNVTVGDGSLVGVVERVAVITDLGEAVIADDGVELAVTAGRGIFNIEAAIGGESGAASTALILFWVVSDAGRLIGFHFVPFVVT